MIDEGLALSWSGGKDSSLALWTLRRQNLEPRVLITTSSEMFDRISHHGVRRSLLARQAVELGIELVEVMIPSPCSMEAYERLFERAFSETILSEIETVAFGDIFLDDLRAYRERKLESAGRTALFPLWKRDTTELAREFIDAGFEGILACVDARKLDPSFAGRRFDHDLLADLPPDVDPCGENGEFHTFVHAGPIFADSIPCSAGLVVERDGMVFCDLIPVPSPVPIAFPERKVDAMKHSLALPHVRVGLGAARWARRTAPPQQEHDHDGDKQDDDQAASGSRRKKGEHEATIVRSRTPCRASSPPSSNRVYRKPPRWVTSAASSRSRSASGSPGALDRAGRPRADLAPVIFGCSISRGRGQAGRDQPAC